MGPALERMILVVTLMVWVWFEGHTQLFICCLKLASVTRGAMPCQTHEWAIGASIRSFFLNSLGERQDPSFFYFFICILPSAGTSDTGKTLPDPRVGIWCQLKAFRIFIIFVFFLYFWFFLRFLCFHHTSNTPRAPPAQWKPLPTSINWQPWHG